MSLLIELKSSWRVGKQIRWNRKEKNLTNYRYEIDAIFINP